MKLERARLKFVARFGYGEALPTDEVQDGPYEVFGSNGAYAQFSRPNTKSPVIIVGRKGRTEKLIGVADLSSPRTQLSSSTKQPPPILCVGFTGFCNPSG